MLRNLAAPWIALPIVAALSAIGIAADDAGKRVYEAKCGHCHGAEGRGGAGPRLVPFEWSLERALELVRSPECDMPPIPASEVSDLEVAQIVDYLRGIKS